MDKAIATREGDDFRFIWENDLHVVMRGVRESSGDLTAIVNVQYVNGSVESLMAPSRLNLVAPQSRKSLAGLLAARRPMPEMTAEDWTYVIEHACGRTYTLWERGEPFVELSTLTLPPWDKRELVRGFVPRNDPLTIFADGGSGKSTYAAAIALSVMTGKEVLPGLPPLADGPILYLDWESNKNEHGHRLQGLARHLGLTLPERFYYRRNYRAFTDDLTAFRREVARLRPVLTIIDSAVPASGDDIKESASPRLLFNGLRALSEEMASLVLAHMSKAEAEKDQGRSRVMGSVMYENLSRSVWEGRPSALAPPDTLVTGFYHRKMNGGRRRNPFALKVHYGEDELPRAFERVDLRAYRDLDDRRQEKDRLYDFLRYGPRTTKDIADALGMTTEGARKACRRLGMEQIGGGRGAGNAAMWQLPLPGDSPTPEPEDETWWTE